MDREVLRTYLLSLPGAVETYPFGPQPLVVKVDGRIFALLSEDSTPLRISLKCEPAHAQFLRSEERRHAIAAARRELEPQEQERETRQQAVLDELFHSA